MPLKAPVPIFAKIMTLFLANIVLLGLGLAWVLHQGWGMMAMPAYRSDKLEKVGGALFRTLEEAPMKDWDGLLAEASNKYKVTFYLYSTDGPLLAGPPDFLPGNVHNEIMDYGDLTAKPPMRPQPMDGPETGRPPVPPPAYDPDARPVLSASSGYWSYLRGYLNHVEGKGKVALVTRADSPTGNGFYANTDTIYWIIGGALLVSVLVWLPFVGSFTRSLRRMQNTAGRLALGEFNARVNEKRNDELGALGRSVNHMADQIGSLVDGQRRLLGDIAHELNSPIARMQAIVGILESQAGGGQQKYVAKLEDELGQMGRLVQEMLSLSKASLRRSVELRPVPLRQQVDRVIERERLNGETIRNAVPEDLVVVSEPELLGRAIGNVVRNAIRYAAHAGPIVIDGRQLDQHQAAITVTDQGPGVPEEALNRLFDAFYRPDLARTRENGGAGLGLAIVKTCIEATHGSVTARNRAGGGLEVCITQSLKPAAGIVA